MLYDENVTFDSKETEQYLIMQAAEFNIMHISFEEDAIITREAVDEFFDSIFKSISNEKQSIATASKMIKNKQIKIDGLYANIDTMEFIPTDFMCIITSDENGKTLSISGMDDKHQIILPFESLAPYLKD